VKVSLPGPIGRESPPNRTRAIFVVLPKQAKEIRLHQTMQSPCQVESAVQLETWSKPSRSPEGLVFGVDDIS
jgi:hypothetical protein